MRDPLESMRRLVETGLEAHLPQCHRKAAKPLDDAVRHAIFPGGKRIRPALTLLGARVFGVAVEEALPAACAVEFLHTSSLIFDDLPCMDDGKIRRGLPVLHVVFGEEVAVLAGLALLNQAYAIFGRTPALIREATRCTGVEGMIGGQALDLVRGPEAEIAGISEQEQELYLSERNRKTSAMMQLALTAGALAGGVSDEKIAVLAEAGLRLGEAFQMADDLLDARRSSEHTGKTAGQDVRHRRPSHRHAEEAEALRPLQEMVGGTRRLLVDAYGENATELTGFVDAMFQRLTAAEQAGAGTGASAAAGVPVL